MFAKITTTLAATLVAIVFSTVLAGAQDSATGQEAVADTSQSYTVLLDVLGAMQIVTYAKVGEEAILGGDMDLGSHRVVQLQSLANTIGLLKQQDGSSAEVQSLVAQLAAALENEPDLRAAVASKTTLWPGRRIPYLISATIKDASLKAEIAAAIDHWNTNTSMQFVPAGATEKVVLRFEDAEGDGYNCYSHVGYTPGAGSYVRLNPVCTLGSVIHEIGHSLGIMHEHSRPDRDLYLAVRSVVADNANYHVVGPLKRSSSYDLCSIMHYSPRQVANSSDPDWFALTAAGQAAFNTCRTELPAKCQQVGQRCMLSSLDRKTIGELYSH